MKLQLFFPATWIIRARFLQMILALSMVVSAADGFAADPPLQLSRQLELWVNNATGTYQQLNNADLSQVSERIYSGKFGNPEDYTLAVEMSWAENSVPGFNRWQPLSWEWPRGAVQGWVRDNKRLSHLEGEAGGDYALSWDVKEMSGLLADYNSLLVDYHIPEYSSVCDFTAVISVERQPNRLAGGEQDKSENWIATYNNSINSIEVLQKVNAADAEWKEKRFGYLLGRLLGLVPTDNWYFAQDGDNTVVQRRMHWPLDMNSILEVHLDPGMEISFINLLIAFSDRHGNGELLNVPVTNPGVLPAGGYGVRLNIGALLRQRFPGRTTGQDGVDAYLQEAIFFLPGTAEMMVQRRAVQQVALLRAKPSEYSFNNQQQDIDRNIQLSGSVLDLGGQGRRLNVDLSDLVTEAGMPIFDLALRSGQLYVTKSENSKNCSITVDAISLGASGQQSIPVYMQEIAAKPNSLGGPFQSLGLQSDLIEGLKFQAYSDLSGFQPVNRKPSAYEPGTEEENRGSALKEWRNSSGLGLIGNEDVELVAGSVLTGSTSSLALQWQRAIELDNESLLYFRIARGLDHVSSLRLILNGSNGEQWQHIIQANEPITLEGAPKKLESLELQMQLMGEPYAVELAELAVFSPVMLNRSQALHVKVPRKLNEALRARSSSPDIAMLSSDPENIVTHWPQEVESAWIDTPLSFPMESVSRLGISYGLPQQWLGEDGCVLAAVFEFDVASVRKEFCVPASSGTLEFSGLDVGMPDQERGKLQNIRWYVNKPAGMTGDFSLRVVIDGEEQTSAWEELQHFPLIQVGNEKFNATAEAFRSARQNAGKQSRFLVKLPGSLLMKLLDRKEVLEGLEGLENPWGRVERILLLTPDNPGEGAWRQLISPEVFPPRSGGLVWSWLWIGGLSGLVWLLYRRNYGYRKLRTTLSFVKMKELLPISEVMAILSVRTVLKWGNLALGLIGTSMLTLLAGNRGLNLQGTSLLMSALVLGVGCCRIGYFLEPATKAIQLKWQGVYRLTAVMAALYLFFILGSRLNDPQGLWGVLPLVAALYGGFPNVYRLAGKTMQVAPYTLWTCFWTGTTAGFFLLGLSLPATSRINEYFTLGGITAVAAGWYVMKQLRIVVESVNQRMARAVYSSAGTVFLTVSLLLLSFMIVLLIFSVQLVAEQLAIIFVYCMVAGVICEIAAYWKRSKN
ncbi:MAG: hypothetical protein RQ899_01725 [Pseudomonadales bacterium]|nr:hypothetical protein [Pseudomonadales bacterium]